MEPSKKKKKFSIRVILIVLVALYFGWILISQQMTLRTMNEQVDELSLQIEELEKEKVRLENDLEHANDRETIENIARSELGLVYPDERKFIDANNKQ